MNTTTLDDVAIVLNGKDTVPDTTKRVDIQNKGTSVFSVDGAGKPTSAVNGMVRTVKKTIGGVGVASCDFNFATAANTNEQVINLGAIVPAKARIIDVYSVTDVEFTGATTLVEEVGTTSSGHDLINSATIYAADAVLAMAADHFLTVAPAVAASSVYVACTPGANWSGVTAGKVSVYVTYIDVTGI